MALARLPVNLHGAGEEFSDRPRCVSAPIAAFLRLYNDHVDDDRRQHLYGLAAAVVDTAAAPVVERERARLLVEWGDELWAQRGRWSIFDRLRRALGRRRRARDYEAAARSAIHAIAKAQVDPHPQTLALVERLVEAGVGRPDADAMPTAAGAALAGHGRGPAQGTGSQHGDPGRRTRLGADQ